MIMQFPIRGIAQPATFDIREGMSDQKAIEEVFVRRCYAPHSFTPRPGERWLDLGANVGAFSVWAALHGARVEAWEPEPECFQLAMRNARLNRVEDSIEFHRAAAWPDRSIRKMLLSVNGANGNVWRSSVVKTWRGGSPVMVDVESIEEFWTPDACVKMDVEGSELAILDKLCERRVKKLVFEYSFDILPEMQQFRDIMARLRAVYDNVRGGPAQARMNEERWVARGPANGVNVFCW